MLDELKMLNVLVRVLRDTFVAWNAAPTRTPVRTVSSCTNACKKQCKTISLRQLAVFWLWNQFRRKIIHDYRRFRARIREGRAEMSEHDGTIGSLGIRRGESFYLCLREQHPPFPPLRQRKLHRLRVGHGARSQPWHPGVAHVAARRRAAHQAGYCNDTNLPV